MSRACCVMLGHHHPEIPDPLIAGSFVSPAYVDWKVGLQLGA